MQEYVATGLLGIATDTLDIDGKVVAQKPFQHVTLEMLQKVIEPMSGNYIWQKPPAYSAKKLNGKRAYNLAR